MLNRRDLMLAVLLALILVALGFVVHSSREGEQTERASSSIELEKPENKAVPEASDLVFVPPGATLDRVVNPSKDLDPETLHTWIDSLTPSLVVSLFYPGEVEPELELVRPDGELITAANVERFLDASFSRQDSIPEASLHFHIDHPGAGKWVVKVNGQPRIPPGKGYDVFFGKDPSNPLLLVPDVQYTEDEGYATVLFAAMAGQREEFTDLELRAAWTSESSPEPRWLRFSNDGQGHDDEANDMAFTSQVWPGEMIEQVRVVAFLAGVRNGERFERKATFSGVLGPVKLQHLEIGKTYVIVRQRPGSRGDTRGEPFELAAIKGRRSLVMRSLTWPGEEKRIPLAAFLEAPFLRIEEAPRGSRKMAKQRSAGGRDERCESFASASENGPWEPSILLTALADVGAECVSDLLSKSAHRPNLNDVHGVKGLLSKLRGLEHYTSFRQRRSVDTDLPNRLLAAAGFPELVDGPYVLLPRDMTLIAIPETTIRFGVPRGSAVVSILLTRRGGQSRQQVRVAEGESLSTPIPADRLSDFSRSWAEKIPSQARAQAGGTWPSPSLTIRAEAGGGLRIGEQSVESDRIAEVLKPVMLPDSAAAVRVELDADLGFGVLVNLLDDLRVAAPDAPVILRGTWQPSGGKAFLLTPDLPDSPAMAFKISSDVPMTTVCDVLQTAVGAGVGSIILLTSLDITDDGAIPQNAFPGGLPGGLYFRIATSGR